MNLSGISSDDLRKIAEKANQLATDLEKAQPSYALALAAGICDCGYNTQANGYINSYEGEAFIKMADGRCWKAVGHSSTGDAWVAYDGFIEFIPLPLDGEK